MRHPWVVIAVSEQLRWGGDLRRHFIYRSLAARTGARVVEGRQAGHFRSALRNPRWAIWRGRPRVATAELLDAPALDLLARAGLPEVLDVHDDPVRHREALAIPPAPGELESLRELRDTNLARFRWLVAQSPTFAELMGLAPDRTLIAPNGSDTSQVVPGPWPERPTVGFASGAAPGRGIETLVDAMRVVRSAGLDARLRLSLVATGKGSADYLAALVTALEPEPWIEIGSAPYAGLSAALAASTVLAVPHPPLPYWDAILPVKLFDSMAAGRPIVVTPRLETANLVRRAGCGAVADGDTPAEIAAAILPILTDERRAREMGARARETAVREFDWRVISDRLADDILARG